MGPTTNYVWWVGMDTSCMSGINKTSIRTGLLGMTAPRMKFILCSISLMEGTPLDTSSWNTSSNSYKRD